VALEPLGSMPPSLPRAKWAPHARPPLRALPRSPMAPHGGGGVLGFLGRSNPVMKISWKILQILKVKTM